MITAIICAAGRGERAGFAENKVLRELNGMPVLCYSLSAFSQCKEVGEILVTCREEDEARIRTLLSPYPNARTVRGGNLRTESVYHALNEAKGEIVLVHDAARPFVTQKIIGDCIGSVKNYESGVCALPATDTTVLAEEGRIQSAPARSRVFTVQTPQGFYKDKLLSAYERAFEEHREAEFTDESGIYAHYIEPPRIFKGDTRNKKLTYSEDFLPAERVGFGIDTHAFADADFFVAGSSCPNSEQLSITLAGVKIPSTRSLKAHSDGDVLAHALMDALLSAAGLRDIGYYFPDTDEKFRGADSMKLLQEVMRFIKEAGIQPVNAGISVLAETPRLSPYIENMRKNVADALILSPTAVGIAAGTNEKLGYVGEGKGITVYATVLCKKL